MTKTPDPADDAATGVVPPDPPLLDLAVLAWLEEDLGRDSMLDLIEIFRTESSRRCRLIETAVAGGDADAARHDAHALKGSALTFGAARLSALAMSLEQAGRAADLGSLVRDVEQLAQLVARTQEALSGRFTDSGQR